MAAPLRPRWSPRRRYSRSKSLRRCLEASGKPRIVRLRQPRPDGQILPVTDPGRYHTAREVLSPARPIRRARRQSDRL